MTVQDTNLQENINQDEGLFMGLVTLFSQGVMQHLGKMVDPITGKVEKNLEAAKATIDLLQMLKNKTSGNLSSQEERYLTTILTNLQLNYVEEMAGEKKDQG